MIQDMTLRVKPNKRPALTALITLLALAAAGFVTSLLVSHYRGLLQLGAAVLIVAALTLYARYLGTRYSYEIFTDGGNAEPLFIVRQETGKRISILCRITLAGIAEAVPLSMKEAKERAQKDTVPRYIYTSTLGVDRVWFLKVRARHESADLIMEGSDEFFTLLKAMAEEAVLLYPPFAEEDE